MFVGIEPQAMAEERLPRDVLFGHAVQDSLSAVQACSDF
jgi:hypothetical protein